MSHRKTDGQSLSLTELCWISPRCRNFLPLLGGHVSVSGGTVVYVPSNVWDIFWEAWFGERRLLLSEDNTVCIAQELKQPLSSEVRWLLQWALQKCKCGPDLQVNMLIAGDGLVKREQLRSLGVSGKRAVFMKVRRVWREDTDDLIDPLAKVLFLFTAQTCHKAQEWLSVMSELSQRLSKGTPAAALPYLQDCTLGCACVVKSLNIILLSSAGCSEFC